MLSEIFKIPESILINETWFYVLSQIIGFGGTILLIFSYQTNKRGTLLRIQMMAAMFFAAQFIMLGALTGAVMNLLSTVRSVVFYYKDSKKWAAHPAWFVIFLAAFVVSGVLTWADGYSMLPIFAMSLANVALWIRSPRKIRLLMFPTSPCWLVYNVHNGSIVGVITEIFTMISLASAIIRFDVIPWFKSRKSDKTV